MAKTIIQTIGPLYGEVVNGTVFGRPNGSIYVPIANTIAMDIPAGKRYVRDANSSPYYYFALCGSTGVIDWSAPLSAVAESQDLANYIEIQFSTSSDFATYTTRTASAGLFNIKQNYVTGPSSVALTPIVAGTTYYVRAVLMSSGGVPVATSATIEVEGVEA